MSGGRHTPRRARKRPSVAEMQLRLLAGKPLGCPPREQQGEADPMGHNSAEGE